MLTFVDDLGLRARNWARTIDPWTNVYGLARTLIALSTAMTLACNRTTTLFVPAAGGIRAPICDGIRGDGLFCLAQHELGTARWVAVALLLLVASGYRPRFTGVIHWWIAFSLQANALTLDGGDNAAAVLSLLLLPVTLTDSRTWHWQPAPKAAGTLRDDAARIIALVTLTAVRVQVAGIYFHASIGKFGVEEWTNGTALYYFTQSPIFGATGIVSTIMRPLLVSAVGVTVLTWSVLVLEYLLSAALFMPKRFRAPLLVGGIIMHAGIILIHGLWSFSITMFAALTLYLRPWEQPWSFSTARRLLSRVARALPSPSSSLATPAAPAAVEQAS